MREVGRIFLFPIFCGLGIACGSGAESGVSDRQDMGRVPADAGALAQDMTTLPDAEPDAGPRKIHPIEWAGLNSSMQLVHELVDPDFCESGWTELLRELRQEGRGHIVPLQGDYVNYFATVEVLGLTLADTYAALGDVLPVTRLSLSWPCFMGSATIREEFLRAIEYVQDAGYRVELTLSHHDTYPADLHEHPDFGMFGGWAHPDAPARFVEYAHAVLDTVQGILPEGSVIYLATEPTPQLFDGYLSSDGKYPPGGSEAGRSLAQAMVNQRDAFLEAGRAIREAGYVPALAPNIRPTARELPGSDLLDYLHNWWLADALVLGCVDDDFDNWPFNGGGCEQNVEPAVDRLGITFYGAMDALDETVEFGLPGAETQPLARRWLEFESDQGQFRYALFFTLERYADEILKRGLQVGVAEIGLSAGSTSTQLRWLEQYYDVMEELGVTFAGIHGIFEHAEFSTGEWFFHLIARCEGRCELTPWGDVFASTVRVRSGRQ